MSPSQSLQIDDVGEAIREGRDLRPAQAYRIQYAQDDLDFRPLDVGDATPLGRQILEAAGANPIEAFALNAILGNGDFEDVRLDEIFDLRSRGAERFVAFKTDRLFRIFVKDDEINWGKPAISGAHLYKLAQPQDDEAVFLDVPGGEDRLIERNDLVDLTKPGVERFIVAPKPKPKFEIIVNARPFVLHDAHVTFEQLVQLAFPGAHEPNTVFSMTYRHAASHPHAGELGAGGSVTVKKTGTIFNVTKTVQS